jgi:hypothetical protein
VSAALRPLNALAAWLGGWGRLLLLVVVVVGVGAGITWERWRHPPVPAEATQVTSALNVDIRQTTFRYTGTDEALRAFYQEALPSRGWRYCGTQATPGCSNLTSLVDRPADAVDVYRRSDDQASRGATVEIWAIPSTDRQLFVTVYETRGQ